MIIGTNLDAFREGLLELLAAEDVEEGLARLEGEPADLLDDEKEGAVCGVTGYGLANLRLVVLVRSARLRLDFEWSLPSPFWDETRRETATREIRLGLQLVYVALTRTAELSAGGRRTEAHVAPNRPLVWRVFGADGTVEREGDDWGTFADLFADKGIAATADSPFVIYP